MVRLVASAAVWLAATAFALAPLSSAAHEGSDPGDRSRIRVRLQPLGDLGSSSFPYSHHGKSKKKGGPSAEVLVHLAPDQSWLQVRAQKLQPGLEYHVLLEGEEVGRFVAGSNGQANLLFANPVIGNALELCFDPRGKTLALNDGVQDVFAAVLSGEGEPPGIQVKEDATIPPTELGVGGVQARYEVLPNGKRSFVVKARGLAPGAYDLVLDGELIASFETNEAGTALVSFSSWGFHGFSSHGWQGKRVLPLDFDPRYRLLEVVQGEDVHFAGLMMANVELLCVEEPPPPPPDTCELEPLEMAFALGPGRTLGSGHARLGAEGECELVFRVHVDGLAQGDYEVFVAGVPEGLFSVMRDASGATAGELAFTANPDAANEDLLDFDPRGQTVEILLGADVVLTGIFPM